MDLAEAPTEGQGEVAASNHPRHRPEPAWILPRPRPRPAGSPPTRPEPHPLPGQPGKINTVSPKWPRPPTQDSTTPRTAVALARTHHLGLQDQHHLPEVAASTSPGQHHLPELVLTLPPLAKIDTGTAKWLHQPASDTTTSPNRCRSHPGTPPGTCKINTTSPKWPHRPARDNTTSPRWSGSCKAPTAGRQDRHQHAEVTASAHPGPHHLPELVLIFGGRGRGRGAGSGERGAGHGNGERGTGPAEGIYYRG